MRKCVVSLNSTALIRRNRGRQLLPVMYSRTPHYTASCTSTVARSAVIGYRTALLRRVGAGTSPDGVGGLRDCLIFLTITRVFLAT